MELRETGSLHSLNVDGTDRQLHYGNAELVGDLDGEFIFEIDGREVSVSKVAHSG